MENNKYLNINDMARIGCNECDGCSKCCHNMGQSIIVDPYDLMRLEEHLGLSFAELMKDYIEIHLEDGLVMPNLCMTNGSSGDDIRCVFLNENGRCSIHDGRPGLCRLFPLGRNYSDEMMQYFVLEEACPAPNKTKVKIKKWVGPEASQEYRQYLVTWHYFTKDVRADLKNHISDDAYVQKKTMMFLNTFFVEPYKRESFFEEINNRISRYKEEM